MKQPNFDFPFCFEVKILDFFQIEYFIMVLQELTALIVILGLATLAINAQNPITNPSFEEGLSNCNQGSRRDAVDIVVSMDS
ncbi:MAG: hypothetical protein AAF806_06450 [Bacteroidota bacterium]